MGVVQFDSGSVRGWQLAGGPDGVDVEVERSSWCRPSYVVGRAPGGLGGVPRMRVVHVVSAVGIVVDQHDCSSVRSSVLAVTGWMTGEAAIFERPQIRTREDRRLGDHIL